MTVWRFCSSMSLALLASCGSGERSPASATDAASDGSNGATEPATDGGSDAADEGAGETMPPMWPDDFDCINMDKAADDACYGEVLFELASEHVVFGDFDGDGHLDVANRVDGQSGTADGLVFHGGLAAGGFAAPVAFALGAETQVDGNPLSLGATRVLTGDSADWLFVQGTYGSFGTVQSDLWWSHGAPALDRFFEPTNAPAGGPWIGDFDGSGPALAFATAGTNLDDLQLYACTASSCDPAGTRTVSGPPSPPWTLLTGDVTGDGLDDLVAITRPPMGGTSEVHVMRSTGGAFTTDPPITLGGGLSAFRLELTEATGDDRLDLVAIGDSGDPEAGDGSALLHVFPGDGAGGFAPSKVLDFGSNINGMTVADFDHDDVPDLIMRLGDIPFVGVILGKGGGEFGDGPIYAVSAESTELTGQLVPRWPTAVDDLDGDGHSDILTVVHRGNLSQWALAVLRAAP